MKKSTPTADLERLDTWVKYRNGLCDDFRATCCTMPAEVQISDLVRMGVIDDFDTGESPKVIAKRLRQAGIVEHFNFKNQLFTLARLSNNDCIYLDCHTRRCRIYRDRPDTCRNHPRIGPRPGFCPYKKIQTGQS